VLVHAIGLAKYRRQKQDDDDKSRTAVGSEFQAVRQDTEKLRDPYRDSR